jgi:hypothetical protein
MLNDLFNFESKLTVDEVEDEIREEQNTHFIEGKAVHTFSELCAILDFMPEGMDSDEEQPSKAAEEEDDDLPTLDAEEEEKLKNDESLKWDEDADDEKDDDKADGAKKDGDDEKEEEAAEGEAEKPRRKSRGKR